MSGQEEVGDRLFLTPQDRHDLFVAACDRHGGPDVFICRPCANAQDAVIERIVARVRAEAAAEALREVRQFVTNNLDLRGSKGGDLMLKAVRSKIDTLTSARAEQTAGKA